MISETRKKEILKMRNAELKIALVLAEEQLSGVRKEKVSMESVKNREISELEHDKTGLQNKLETEVSRCVEIRNAIETIAAVKYPGAEFQTPVTYPVQMPSQSAEPDELLFLRHLYRLSGW